MMDHRGRNSIGAGATLVIVFFAAVLPPVQAATTTRVSVSSTGVQGDRYVFGQTSISGDGRYVAFESRSTNLVPGDTNDDADVFRHDRLTGQTIRVSVTSEGAQLHGRSHNPKLSGDGRYVLFINQSLAPPHGPVYVHDCLTGETKGACVPRERVLVNADAADISSDGNRVAYRAQCDGILPGVSGSAVYVYDFRTDQTSLASVTSGGTPVYGTTPDISADGRFVAFRGPDIPTTSFSVSNILVHDCVTGQTTTGSVSSTGAPADGDCMWPAISGDGRYVAFVSMADNLPQPAEAGWAHYVHDRVTGETRLIARAGEYSAFSANGQYFAFESYDRNLVPGDTNNNQDVFVYDWLTGSTRRVSVTKDGTQGLSPDTWGSSGPSISADGRYVAFVSGCSNLVSGDTNNLKDAFVRDTKVELPVVTTWAPQGTTVSTSSPVIRVTFSMPMDKASVQNAFTMSPNETGSFSWFENELSYTVSGALEYDTPYAVTIAGTATSSSGEALAAPFSWSFTTASPPSPVVTSRSPQGTACTVAGPIKISFDQAMDAASVQSAFSLSPSRAGTFSWSGNELSYSLSSPLASGTNYKVTLGTTAKSALGASLPEEISWTFKTATVVTPAVILCTPKGTGLPVTAKIVVRFNTPMKQATVQDALYINGVKATGTFTWLGTKFTYAPPANWLRNKRYQVKITTAAKSKAGLSLPADKIWNFTTSGMAPALVTATAAPTATGAQFTLNLTSAAYVTVTIRNLAGREIAVLTPGQLDAGIHSLLWNGKSSAGTKAPAGAYLLQVAATGADGARCSAVTPLRR